MSLAPGLRDACFPDLEARAFLAHAAVSPLPAASLAAVHGYLGGLARRGIGGLGDGLAARDALKRELAALLGTSPDRFALTSGTTASIIALAQSVRWRPGDVVATLDGEFPANVTPWRQAAAARGLAVRTAPAAALAGPDRAAHLERLLAPGPDGRVRLLAVSAVQFQTGLRMPLAELAAAAHAVGALLFVDAIQAAGVVPLDLPALGVDLAAGGAHKWLLGMDGAGYLWVAPGREDALGTDVAGWLSHVEPLRFLGEGPGFLTYDRPFLPAPRVFEGSSTATAAYVALHASVRLLLAQRIPAIYDHVQRWHDNVLTGLEALGFTSERAVDPALRSGILALRPPPGVDLGLLQRELAARGVVVSIPDGRLRLAPHFANPLDECPAVIEAVAQSLPAAHEARP